ncbi:hypothetical protein M8C21_000239 [Ambrosia artemisiifolia]|uniref:Cyclin-dependent kinase inhibitor n=1 Tax=Ambrosia artemisiifolia TaxID=4212 RepID=A0AAD5BNH9_AMBAR|nr:hypothetical protein M8C21_000239 [Ambrosia artemisiifolia]
MDTNRCKTVDETSLMTSSNSHSGVRRSRDTDATTSDSAKRRKFDHCEPENVVVELQNHCHSEIDVHSAENYVSSAEFGDHVVSSTCLKDDLNLDLKTELCYKTETSMSSNDGFRETSSSSEICLDSDEMESSSSLKTNPPPASAATSRCKQSTTAKTPTAAEIDEFFSAIEKKEQQRFVDKYNYDIVNDVPMEGRYKWVQLKQ